jgi:hypothetical protein
LRVFTAVFIALIGLNESLIHDNETLIYGNDNLIHSNENLIGVDERLERRPWARLRKRRRNAARFDCVAGVVYCGINS